MSSSYAAWNAGEVERVGVLDVRDEQRARAVGLLAGRSRARGSRARGARRVGLPSTTPKPEFIAGHLAATPAQHRERDEVREADLAAARPRSRWLFRIWRLTSSSLAGDRRAPTSRSGPRGSPPCSRRCAPPRRAAAAAVSPSMSTSGAVAGRRSRRGGAAPAAGAARAPARRGRRRGRGAGRRAAASRRGARSRRRSRATTPRPTPGSRGTAGTSPRRARRSGPRSSKLSVTGHRLASVALRSRQRRSELGEPGRRGRATGGR